MILHNFSKCKYWQSTGIRDWSRCSIQKSEIFKCLHLCHKFVGACNVLGDQELKAVWKLTCSKGIKEAPVALVPKLTFGNALYLS